MPDPALEFSSWPYECAGKFELVPKIALWIREAQAL
jgi:hypothetical protein